MLKTTLSIKSELKSNRTFIKKRKLGLMSMSLTTCVHIGSRDICTDSVTFDDLFLFKMTWIARIDDAGNFSRLIDPSDTILITRDGTYDIRVRLTTTGSTESTSAIFIDVNSVNKFACCGYFSLQLNEYCQLKEGDKIEVFYGCTANQPIPTQNAFNTWDIRLIQ
jgi:hypothetical protein